MNLDAPVLVGTKTKFTLGELHDKPDSYRCHLAIHRESDGTFSAVVLNLAGAGSCGDSLDEAVANVREAVAGIIGSFKEDQEDIPWRDSTQYDVPEDAIQKWILVNA